VQPLVSPEPAVQPTVVPTVEQTESVEPPATATSTPAPSDDPITVIEEPEPDTSGGRSGLFWIGALLVFVSVLGGIALVVQERLK